MPVQTTCVHIHMNRKLESKTLVHQLKITTMHTSTTIMLHDNQNPFIVPQIDVSSISIAPFHHFSQPHLKH